jgi:exodeoxyribonuclease VII large subunit
MIKNLSGFDYFCDMNDDRKIYSLTQLTTSLEQFIMKNFAATAYWVAAEITKFNTKGGHVYLELADSSDGQLLSQINANFWYTNRQQIIARNGSAIEDVMKIGNKVLFLVRIDYHKIFGLKLNILDIDPTYSYGEMERQKQLTIEKLKSEGLYALQKTVNLKRISRKIALIASPETSGYRDFMNELFENNLYTNFQVKVFASSVQGNEAKHELIKQIKEAQQYDVDAIVIIRGGGSKTDLNIFNDYELCREIALCTIPIVTGIGHETDDVVAAHVSRLDCITPTAAGKHFYIQISSFISELRSTFDQLMQKALILLQAHHLEFHDVQKRLGFWSKELLQDQKYELEHAAQHLHRLVHFNIISKFQDLEMYLAQMNNAVVSKIELENKSVLPALLDRMDAAVGNKIQQEKFALNQLSTLLDVLNPLQLLKKGYTLSSINDQDLNQLEHIESGQKLTTLTDKHLILSTIDSIKIINHEQK